MEKLFEIEECGDSPLTWVPEEGSVVSGKLLHYGMAGTKHGQVPTCVVEDEELGPVTICLNEFTLLYQFSKLRPRPGESVVVRCLGRDPGKLCSDFVVRVKGKQICTHFGEGLRYDASVMQEAA